MNPPKVQIHLLPGGIMPDRKSTGAAGYDVAIRAVVSSSEMDPKNKAFRRVLFDFASPPEDPNISPKVHNLSDGLVYRMDPEESVLVGIGFATVMPPDMFYWIAPRSGLASRWGITVTNAPGTVDSDYRGEAGVLVYNRNKTPFDLRRGMRIAQILFQYAYFPEFEAIANHADLVATERGAGGFGSTGLRS
ncbi:MAG: dUTP diphosphatase [Patescibacteria group bacterium]